MTNHVERSYRRYDTAKLVLLIVTVVFVAASMVLLVSITTAIRGTQLDNRRTQKATLTSQRLIVDCTSPEGHCFKQAAKRQAAIIGDPPAPINNVVILAAACADKAGVDTEAQIRACVLAGLKERQTP